MGSNQDPILIVVGTKGRASHSLGLSQVKNYIN
ncbi:hypothetical protein TorRG33x02_092470 [Trema orientale]|uniref:Uncharacterized protein n=1 Tax=Trema orientale TaxID=63057 RepID=A0A2P5FBA0_TREOI|nr:hypothetical protein TorRG33x02_092470 [Trema orientale]